MSMLKSHSMRIRTACLVAIIGCCLTLQRSYLKSVSFVSESNVVDGSLFDATATHEAANAQLALHQARLHNTSLEPHGNCTDKGPILTSVKQIVKQVKKTYNVNVTINCSLLPNWSDVAAIYGSTPVILGLERCANYRLILNGTKPRIRVAGLYNSGTNAFAQTLDININTEPARGLPEYDRVEWGKHTFLHNMDKIINTSVVDIKHTLPVVLARDPYQWMNAMVSIIMIL
jgi:hypothetical protein